MSQCCGIWRLIQRSPWRASSARPQRQRAVRQWGLPPPAPPQPTRAAPVLHATARLAPDALRAPPPPANSRRRGSGGGRTRGAAGALHLAHRQQAHTRCWASESSTAESAAQADAAPYETLREQHYAELEVKKSKFLTTAWPISSPEEALERVAAARDPSASHNCWAYRIAQEFRSSDDGEPGGTAGRPILAAIEGAALEAVCVLVTRHFGGVKLGTGGLVRAYGGAARQCLQQAPRCTVTPKAEIQMEVPFADIGTVYQLLDQHAAVRISEDYDTGTAADVLITVRVEVPEVQGLVDSTTNATSGRVTPRRV